MKTGGMSQDDIRPASLAGRRRLGQSVRGSIIIYALIILAVCTLVLAGWVQLMTGVAEYSDSLEQGIVRRLNMENSRNMAVQYLRASVLTGTSNAGIVSPSVTWSGTFVGGINIPAIGTVANVLTTTSEPVRWNPFSPAGTTWGNAYFAGFSANATTAIFYDGVGSTTWTIQARSRSPLFGFDPVNLSQYTTFPGSLTLPASAALGTSDGPRTSGSGLLNAAFPLNQSTPMSVVSYPGATATIGTTSVSVTSFSSTQANGGQTASNRATRLWTGTAGNIAIIYPYRDATPNAPSAKIYNITGANTNQILISPDSGTSTVAIPNPSAAPPILIQCSAANNPLNITIFRGNVRPIYLRIANSGACNVVISSALLPAQPGNSTRLLGIFGGTSQLKVLAPSGSTLTGGLQSMTGDIRFRNEADTASSTLTIARDTTSMQLNQLLELMANRNGWVEVFQND